jgi:hypothetical protein
LHASNGRPDSVSVTVTNPGTYCYTADASTNASRHPEPDSDPNAFADSFPYFGSDPTGP